VLVGVQARLIEIETVVGSGFSGLNILGLPTDITRDMRERVRSALESAGIPIPARRVVVNIGPSEYIKLSRTPLSQLDFAVAASIVHALFQEEEKKKPLVTYQHEILSGELSLEGKLKPVNNYLIFNCLHEYALEDTVICLPTLQTPEEKLDFERKKSFEFSHYCEDFLDIQDWLYKRQCMDKIIFSPPQQTPLLCAQNSADSLKITAEQKASLKETIKILMQNPQVCVGILVACAGQHNILLAGEPGIGKSFSIQQIPHLFLPISSLQKTSFQLINPAFEGWQRPLRTPHHSSTSASLVGGASLKPGEVTLAHGGILFLDELAEFSRNSLEALREPLDNKHVTISRSGGSVTYPADFQLCATTNPCACGYLFSRKKPCRCNPRESRKYLQKLSGPMLDRFCLQVWMQYQEEWEWDIFCQEMVRVVSEETLLDEFVEHFIEIQKEGEQKNKLTSHTHVKKISFFEAQSSHLSLRGKEKISQIVKTFQKVFPHLPLNPEYLDQVLTYRQLGSLFTSISL